MGTLTDSLDDGAEQPLLLVVTSRGRLARRARDDEPVVAAIDQMRGQLLYAVVVDVTVSRHRCHHRGEQPAERCAVGARWSHVTRLARGLAHDLGERSREAALNADGRPR